MDMVMMMIVVAVMIVSDETKTKIGNANKLVKYVMNYYF